jgi:hypothetical protein
MRDSAHTPAAVMLISAWQTGQEGLRVGILLLGQAEGKGGEGSAACNAMLGWRGSW